MPGRTRRTHGRIGVARWGAVAGGMLATLILSELPAAGLASVRAPGPPVVGLASWYGREFHGRPTTSGEPFDMYALTAAHRTLPLGTHVRVTNLENGRHTVVRLTDRGPFVDGRIIDLSYSAGRALGMTGRGVVRVRLEPVDGSGAAWRAPAWRAPGRQVAWAPEGSHRAAGAGPER